MTGVQTCALPISFRKFVQSKKNIRMETKNFFKKISWRDGQWWIKKFKFLEIRLIKKKSKIFLAGHNGLVGSSIFIKLKLLGFENIITINKKKLNLINQRDVFAFLKKTKPDIVINAAARVGGIHANNKYRAEFIYENLSIQNNIIHGCFLNKIKNLIFLGSSCVYPKNCKQPIKEEYLLTGPLEKTNESYSIAKI